MHLTPKEQDKLTLLTMGMVAERRLQKGLKLNYPEAVAYITARALEGAREGKTVEEVMHDATTLLSGDDVMEGVPEMISLLQVEAVFTDGSRLVSIHHPVKPGQSPSSGTAVGGVVLAGGDIGYNAGRPTAKLKVRNTGDRPIQVGSHLHFFEANRYLEFDREAAFGCHLNIPATTAIRFEPGEEKEVEVVAFGGKRRVVGFNGLTGGFTGTEDAPAFYPVKVKALAKMRRYGFRDAGRDEADAEQTSPSTDK